MKITPAVHKQASSTRRARRGNELAGRRRPTIAFQIRWLPSDRRYMRSGTLSSYDHTNVLTRFRIPTYSYNTALRAATFLGIAPIRLRPPACPTKGCSLCIRRPFARFRCLLERLARLSNCSRCCRMFANSGSQRCRRTSRAAVPNWGRGNSGGPIQSSPVCNSPAAPSQYSNPYQQGMANKMHALMFAIGW
jgi:hypothetical protein